jgi:hypothetical protein
LKLCNLKLEAKHFQQMFFPAFSNFHGYDFEKLKQVYYTETVGGMLEMAEYLEKLKASNVKIPKKLRKQLNPQSYSLVDFTEARDRGFIGKSQWANFTRTIGMNLKI